MPWTKPSTYSCQTAISPVSASTASTAAFTASTRLARHDHAPQVDPVGDRAADERERGDRERLDERERSDGDRRVRQLEHEPVRSDLLHPRPDERDAVAGEVEPVVAVSPQAAEGAVAERGERGDRLQA